MPPNQIEAVAPHKKHHILGPSIIFVLCLIFFGLSAFFGGLFMATSIPYTFIVGAVTISVVVTGIFSLIAFFIRRIAEKYGKKYFIISWLVVLLLPIAIIGSVIWYRNLPSEIVRSFRNADLSQVPGQDWKTYINEPFDLSLKYPPTMKLDETPSAWGFDDMYSVNLEPLASTTPISLLITATTDKNKCSDLVANDTYMPLSAYKNKKTIQGKEFLLDDTQLFTVYGVIQTLAYVQKNPICKVAIVSFSSFIGTSSSAINQSEYIAALRTAESVIGSMDTGVKDTGTSDTMFAGESRYALGMEMTRISGARLAAFRVYNYSSDNSPKAVKSYIGTCEDGALKITEPGITCRESKDAFLMYYKMNNRYGYACGDTDWYGIVSNEPKGLTCKNDSSVVPTIVQNNTASLNSKTVLSVATSSNLQTYSNISYSLTIPTTDYFKVIDLNYVGNGYHQDSYLSKGPVEIDIQNIPLISPKPELYSTDSVYADLLKSEMQGVAALNPVSEKKTTENIGGVSADVVTYTYHDSPNQLDWTKKSVFVRKGSALYVINFKIQEGVLESYLEETSQKVLSSIKLSGVAQ